MSERLTYDSDRLIRDWRDRYAGRRTIAWQMLTDAEALVRDAIARELEQVQRQARTDREWELERRERAVERAGRERDWQVDRLRRELAEAREKIASLSPRQTLMREERETVEDGTVVRILAPTVPSYGDKSSPRPWMLGELEDVAYRLRAGGAQDDTEVRFKRDAVEACVPFPESALTAPAPPSAPALLNRATGVQSLPAPVRILALVAAVALIVFFVLAVIRT